MRFVFFALFMVLTPSVNAQEVEQHVSPAEARGEAHANPNDGGEYVSPGALHDVGQSMNGEGSGYPDQANTEHEGRDAPWPWEWILLGDNPAQATMAWASIVAAFAALLAAVLLWLTFSATRRIGEAQTRAYLSIGGGEYDVTQAYLTINMQIRNSGNSPARESLLRTTFSASLKKESRGNMPQQERITFTMKPTIIGEVQSGAKKPCTIYYHWDSGNDVRWDRILSHIDKGGAFGLKVDVDWVDVFGVKCTASAQFWCKWVDEIEEWLDHDNVILMQRGSIDEDGRLN